MYYANMYLFQFNSSKFSHIMPDEVREHLTRDQRPFLHPESLQTLQIPSSMTVLLLFSSPHSFSTGFRSEDWNGHSRSLVLCSVTHFCVVFEVNVWIIVRLENPNMAHFKISNRDNHLWFFYLLVFDRIHDADAMCLNKMSRTSSRNIGPQHKKIQQYISLYIWGTFYPSIHQIHLERLLLKKQFLLVSSDHRTQSHLKFQPCLVTEYALDNNASFLDELGSFFLKPSQTTRGAVGAVWKCFLVF